MFDICIYLVQSHEKFSQLSWIIIVPHSPHKWTFEHKFRMSDFEYMRFCWSTSITVINK